MVFSLLLIVLTLPRLLGTAWASLAEHGRLLGAAFGDGDILGVLVRLLAIVAVVIPLLGIGYVLGRLVRRTAAAVWRRTEDRPVRRGVAVVLVALLVAGLGWAWWPDGDRYRPVRAWEGGTLLDAVPASAGSGPGARVRGRDHHELAGGVRAPADGGRARAGAGAHPRVARGRDRGRGRRVGHRGGRRRRAPTWVFPFDAPAAPGEGDNQALAVNTTDGSVAYDVSFALVWVEGDTAVNRNEAYALASCRDCRTVAVAFQVVLLVGSVDVVVPENVAVAVNYACVECVTQALATQLVVTLPGELSQAGTDELAAIWAELQTFGEELEGLPLAELRDRLTDYEVRILDVVQRDGDGPSDAGGGRHPTGDTATDVGTDGTGHRRRRTPADPERTGTTRRSRPTSAGPTGSTPTTSGSTPSTTGSAPSTSSEPTSEAPPRRRPESGPDAATSGDGDPDRLSRARGRRGAVTCAGPRDTVGSPPADHAWSRHREPCRRSRRSREHLPGPARTPGARLRRAPHRGHRRGAARGAGLRGDHRASGAPASSASCATGPARPRCCAPTWTPCPVARGDRPALRSTATGTGADGVETPVMHACGHDVHVTCLLGAAATLVAERDTWTRHACSWSSSPPRRSAAAPQSMIDDGIFDRFGRPDVVLGQHVGPLPAGLLGLRRGPAFAGADMLHIVLHGRGGHGSRPETTVDPVVMAAATVMRLQTVVSREVAGGESAVVTVGALHAGNAGNVIPERADMQVSLRSYDAEVRERLMTSIERIVRAEAAASGAPQDPEVILKESFPVAGQRPGRLRADPGGLRPRPRPRADASTPVRSPAARTSACSPPRPVCRWSTGCWAVRTRPHFAGVTDREGLARVVRELPSNHSAQFAPVIEPTLSTGVKALVSAARTWLPGGGPPDGLTHRRRRRGGAPWTPPLLCVRGRPAAGTT